MSLIPIYVYECDTELPEEGTYFVVAANGMFMHKDVGIIKALVRFNLDKVPLLKDFVPPKQESLPVYIYDDECGDLPEDGNYFLVAKNGVHARRQTPKFAKAEFSDIPNLGILTAKVRFDLPKIPAAIIWRALLFFRRVWYSYKAEAAVVLFYNSKTQEYYLHCPKQQVSAASVSYGTIAGQVDPDEISFINEMRQKDFSRIGTIHSHCNFSAYHSGVDTNDEAEWPDGVHITIGDVDKKHFSIASSLVVNDNRFQVEPTTVMNGLLTAGGFYDASMTQEEKEALIGLHQQEIENEWMLRVTPAYRRWKIVKQDVKPDSDRQMVRFLRKIRNFGVALRFNRDDDRAGMLSALKKFFRKDVITDDDILEAASVNPRKPSFYKEKGYVIE